MASKPALQRLVLQAPQQVSLRSLSGTGETHYAGITYSASLNLHERRCLQGVGRTHVSGSVPDRRFPKSCSFLRSVKVPVLPQMFGIVPAVGMIPQASASSSNIVKCCSLWMHSVCCPRWSYASYAEQPAGKLFCRLCSIDRLLHTAQTWGVGLTGNTCQGIPV